MSDDNSLTLARQIAAQAWCTEANARKVMDVDLCDAFAHLMAAELDRLRAELAAEKARTDRSGKLLAGIYAMMYPAPIKTADGRTMVFRPKSPDPHAVLQELSDRIRALSAALVPDPPA